MRLNAPWSSTSSSYSEALLSECISDQIDDGYTAGLYAHNRSILERRVVPDKPIGQSALDVDM